MTFRLFCLSRIPCNSSSWLCKGCKQEAMALCACHLANCRMNSTSSSENITNKCREKPPDLQRNFSGGKGTYPALFFFFPSLSFGSLLAAGPAPWRSREQSGGRGLQLPTSTYALGRSSSTHTDTQKKKEIHKERRKKKKSCQ